MTVLLRNLPLALEHGDDDLGPAAAAHLGLDPGSVHIHALVKKSLDARRRGRPRFLYTLALDLAADDERRLLAEQPPPVECFRSPQPVEIPTVRMVGSRPPVVVGAGPAGLFAAFRLVQAGFEPIIIERGLEVTERTRQWNRFLKGDAFNPESNLLFGEGGAGAYSDGKLYTRVNDPRVAEVLQILADHGAPREIVYDAKPHIGSNLLPSVIRRLRNTLRDRGAVFRFSTRMTGLIVDKGGVRGVVLDRGEVLETGHVFLGFGHSARDTIRALHDLGIAMERKPFQIGARIEHPQSVINRMQYGKGFCTHPRLPAADYRLVAKMSGGDLFSFCMCPGGEILPATERPGVICVNGASPLGRRGRFANSGFVITLDPAEFGSGGPLAGIELQERIEGRAAALAVQPFGGPRVASRRFSRAPRFHRAARIELPVVPDRGALRGVSAGQGGRRAAPRAGRPLHAAADPAPPRGGHRRSGIAELVSGAHHPRQRDPGVALGVGPLPDGRGCRPRRRHHVVGDRRDAVRRGVDPAARGCVIDRKSGTMSHQLRLDLLSHQPAPAVHRRLDGAAATEQGGRL